MFLYILYGFIQSSLSYAKRLCSYSYTTVIKRVQHYLAWPLLQSACAILNEMATFASAQVSGQNT